LIRPFIPGLTLTPKLLRVLPILGLIFAFTSVLSIFNGWRNLHKTFKPVKEKVTPHPHQQSISKKTTGPLYSREIPPSVTENSFEMPLKEAPPSITERTTGLLDRSREQKRTPIKWDREIY
jgi:hypothetical protein